MQVLAYLITHAATRPQRSQDANRWTLSETGQAQADALARAAFWAQVDQVVISSEPKTWLTVAGVVAQRRLPVWVDSRLDELRRGGWVDNYGQRVAQALARPDVGLGDWEPPHAALARVRAALDDVTERFAGQVVAVVGHGLTLSLLRADLHGYGHVRLDDWARLGFAAVAAVELPAGHFVQDFPLETSATRG